MPDDTAPAPETTAADTAGATDTITLPVGEFEQLKRDITEWKERCIRQQAEFENVRKRLRKEADEAATRGVVRAVKPVLGELDNLERALDAADPAAFVEFAQGVTMIQENLKAALAGLGVEQVLCDGVFDPAVHEVLAEQESAEHPRGTIVQIHRRGWKLKDQLVRAAQVVVAKPPATGASAQA
jgi:molecular chaperone GrpE